MITDALARKQISHSYHTSFPRFLMSAEPFDVNVHSIRLPTASIGHIDKVQGEADSQYLRSVQNLGQQRLQQRHEFFGGIKKEQDTEEMKKRFTRANQLNN